MRKHFLRGIHPVENKESTAETPIEIMPVSARLFFPISQHIGAPCTPIVKVGDLVSMGQCIATSPTAVSASIHSTVSGLVTDILPWDHPSGAKVLTIVIDNDGKDTLDPSILKSPCDYSGYTSEEFMSLVQEAGVVGMGGATFPTHIKIATALGKADTIIINAAECEPFLTCNYRSIIEKPDSLIKGLHILEKMFPEAKIIIGIEDNKPKAIKLLNEKLLGSKIEVFTLETKYPQGGEKQLIHSVTGRVVPIDKFPFDIGCVVFNTETVLAIYRAVTYHAPTFHRIITVAGSAVRTPKNVQVRLGTPLKEVFEYCGGFLEAPGKIIMGGPMMGIALFSLDSPVIKATSGLLAFKTKDVTKSGIDCIRCGRCISVCPMKLMPNYIASAAKREDFEQCEKLHNADCIECGCCSYICPAKLPLVHNLRIGKSAVIAARAARAKINAK